MQRNYRLPDIDEGFIESQSDKSTDDQSSDKESSDSDEDLLSMTDVSEVHDISEREKVYWVKSVLALKITADDALSYLARSNFKQFFDSLTSSEKKNLQDLLDIAQNRHKKVKDHRVWVVNSPECRSLLEKLVSAHWDPADIEWRNIGDDRVDSYWKIAKLYMPQGNKDSTNPEDTNMLAIFHLLKNFKVQDFVKEIIEIDQMIRHSKDLISHSHDNRISKKKMTVIFKNINKFLESNKLSNEIKSKTTDGLKKVQRILNSGNWNWYKSILTNQRTGLAAELDTTEQFLNITKKLLIVLKADGEKYMCIGALAGGATGALLGQSGFVFGLFSGYFIGKLFFDWKYKLD